MIILIVDYWYTGLTTGILGLFFEFRVVIGLLFSSHSLIFCWILLLI